MIEDVSGYWQELRKGLPAVQCVDDTTWRDLDMDQIFSRMDATVSPTDSEALYTLLRHIGLEDERLHRREAHIRLLQEDEALRLKVQLALSSIRKAPFHGAYRFSLASPSPSRIMPGSFS